MLLAVVVGVGSTVVVVTTVVDVLVVGGVGAWLVSVSPSANSIAEVSPKSFVMYSMIFSYLVGGFYLGRWEYQKPATEADKPSGGKGPFVLSLFNIVYE